MTGEPQDLSSARSVSTGTQINGGAPQERCRGPNNPGARGMTKSAPLAAAIAAQPGPQTEFLRSPADICIYGGAAGGGKTVGLILEPL